jgi:co-chaperonin GroES (HSP10)
MSLKTIFHKVLLKEIKINSEEPLIQTDPDPKKPIKAIIISVPLREPFLFQGGEVYFEPISEGEIANFYLKDARELEIDNEKHYIVDERDILYLEK